MIQAPCKDCKDRQLGCHSICQKYIDFKKEQEVINLAKRKDTILRYYDIDRINRFKKRSK